MSRRIAGAVVVVVSSALAWGSLLGGCSSDSSTSGGAADSGPATGSLGLAEGPCTDDTQCKAEPAGPVGCFIGGQGGGAGDGGATASADSGVLKQYCTYKCDPTQDASVLCAAPFLGVCNARGYCKLN